jgi:cell division initiation protein
MIENIDNDNLLQWAKRKDKMGRLTPIEIKNKDFSKKLKGYNKDEVNDFLNEVYENYKDLFRENSLLKEQLLRAEAEIVRFKSLEEKMNTAILNAQSMGDEIRNKALKETKELMERTEVESTNTLKDANEKAKNIIAEAIGKRDKTMNDLNSMKTDYLTDVNKLKKYRESLIREMKDFFQSKATELHSLVEKMKNENKDPSNSESK